MANVKSIDLELNTPDYFTRADGDTVGLNPADGDFTIEAWFKIESAPNARQCIVGKGSGGAGYKRYHLKVINLAGKFYVAFEIDDNSVLKVVTGTTALNAATWYYVAGVRDGNNLRIYLGDVGTAPAEDAVATDITSYGDIDEALPFAIGSGYNNGSPADYFDGLIDEVRVWNDARSSAEITANYKSEIDPASTNLQGYWSFDDVLTDKTSNGNDLTAQGNTNYSADIVILTSFIGFIPSITII